MPSTINSALASSPESASVQMYLLAAVSEALIFKLQFPSSLSETEIYEENLKAKTLLL